MAYTVIIADDHDIIREGLKNILRGHSDYQVVKEAANGPKALEAVEKIKPDVILLDISMPKLSGLDAIKEVKRLSPQTKILIVTVYKTYVYIIKAFEAGADGYLVKEKAARELLPALAQIVNDKTYLTPSVSSRLIEKAIKEEFIKSAKKEILTKREKEILHLVGEGKTAKEIGNILYISARTVENYKNDLLKKLGLHRTADLIKYAIKHKIVDIEEY
ncbi:MAG: response regulator transcription factor [Candidatus Omnitrophica bacterium]|nr:response regulator transcription factor [Candidatus Omnitrophota bacterium]